MVAMIKQLHFDRRSAPTPSEYLGRRLLNFLEMRVAEIYCQCCNGDVTVLAFPNCDWRYAVLGCEAGLPRFLACGTGKRGLRERALGELSQKPLLRKFRVGGTQHLTPVVGCLLAQTSGRCI